MEIRVIRNILAANDAIAAANRALFDEHGIRVFNIMGSPGSGKTALLEATVKHLAGKKRIAVIEGDPCGSFDAERLAKHQIPVYQINTANFGSDCHLEARMIQRTMTEMPLTDLDLVFIENVGNLVCPADFDLGEHRKVIVLSVTEGEDKPLKYPPMFQSAAAVVISKVDLLPHLRFDYAGLLANLGHVNPAAKLFNLSIYDDNSMQGWITFVEAG